MKSLLAFMFILFVFGTAAIIGGGVKAIQAPTVFLIRQGDLILNGDNVTTITDTFHINGSIIVTENATLILRNAILNFTQEASNQFNMTFTNGTGGHPHLIAENSTITGNGHNLDINLESNSSARTNRLTLPMGTAAYCRNESASWIADSTIYQFWTTQSANVHVANSTIAAGLLTYHESTINIYNCTFGSLFARDNSVVFMEASNVTSDIEIRSTNVNCTIANHKPTHISNWSFMQNCSVTMEPLGDAPNVTAEDTEVGGWGFTFLGTSNATVTGSELQILRTYNAAHVDVFNSTIESTYTWDSSDVWLVSTNVSYTNTYEQSILYQCWYLNVHVEDSAGQSIPFANVTAHYANATKAESKLTDLDGKIRFILIEKTVDTTGAYALGNYLVETTYQAYSNSTWVNVIANMQVTLHFSDITIPEFPSQAILPLFMILALIALAIRAKKCAGIPRPRQL